MHVTKRVMQFVVKLLLYVGIATFVFLNAEEVNTETALLYLGVSAAIWAVVWFVYVFVRDTLTAARWKKTNFPLPQYIQKDTKLDRMEADWASDPSDPTSPVYSGNIGLRSLSKK